MANSIEKTNSKKTNDNSTIVVTMNKKTISICFLAIAALLMFIGIFGTILIAKTTSGTISEVDTIYNLQYIFSKGWDDIRLLADAGLLTNSAEGFAKFELIIQMISFFIAIGGVTIIILRNIYLTYKKQDIKINLTAALLMVSSFQYVLMSRFVNLSSGRVTINDSSTISTATSKASLGWGAVLIVIGFFVALIGLLINESNKEGNLLSQSNVISKIGIIIAFFIGIFGLTALAQTSISTVQSSTTTKLVTNRNVFQWILALHNVEDASAIKNYSSMLTGAIFSLAFSFIAIISFVIVLFLMIKGDLKANKGQLIAFSITYFVAFLLANILLRSSLAKNYSDISEESTIKASVTLGYTGIVGIILGALLVISNIASSALVNKTIKFAKK